MSKPILVKNTKEMVTNLDFSKCIKVADLGCSSGQNTFLAMSEIVNTINALCQERNQIPPEIDCCLKDLPGNDFNTTFKFISFFNEKLTSKTPCFVSGVPGSFHSRLFPSKSLHFIHSNCGLNYLSKVPEGLEKNKMSVYITSSSPLSEYKAYLNQFQKDFTTFLRMRSEEMVSNGRMVITLLGRNAIDDPLYRDCCHHLTLVSDSLRDLVFEGLVSASKVISFNMPLYDPTDEELKEIIINEGSFQINDLETHAFDLGHSKEENRESCRAKPGEKEANCIRAAFEMMLVAHFGDAINIDTLFAKYAHHVSQHASCMRKTSVILVVSWFGNNLTIYQGITCVVLIYCPSGDFLLVSIGSSCSHGWRGIMSGRDIIVENSGWAIGDGESLNVWDSARLSLSQKESPMGPAPEALVELKVSDLFLAEKNEWDLAKIRQFLPIEENKVRLLKPSLSGAPDKLMWLKSATGEFTTKTVIPQDNCVLVRSDAAWNETNKIAGLGWTIKTQNRVSSFSSPMRFVGSPLIAEGLALREAVEKCRDLGLTKIRCESDCAQLIKALTLDHPLAELYDIVADIEAVALSFDFVSFTWISRERNRDADSSAKQVLSAELALMVSPNNSSVFCNNSACFTFNMSHLINSDKVTSQFPLIN
ncbi:hypothetical protein YC2023_120853 [Brassica napus]